MALSPVLSSAPNFVIDQGLEYYAGKTELLDWINHLLELNLTRLEQLTSGAIYCQILDAFYADVVAIRKVNFFAREEYEIIPNYKVLQAAFNALGFTKELNVSKLSQASPPDLMEFAQWLYKSFKGAPRVSGYSPNHRRQQSIKGGTVNIPLPACLQTSAFEFTRIDLRTSGNYGGTTPLSHEAGRVRGNRSVSVTPGTGSKSSGGRRTPPYLNVTSRYKESLAVPPEHYERRSPRLSPGSSGGELRKRIMMSHRCTQTDFPEEEYRFMTDVGTEVAPPRLEQRDYGQQYEDIMGDSPSGSVVSPSPSELISHGLGSENFSFGRQRSGIPSGQGIPLSPRTTMSPTGSLYGYESGIGDRKSPRPESSYRGDGYGDYNTGGRSGDGKRTPDSRRSFDGRRSVDGSVPRSPSRLRRRTQEEDFGDEILEAGVPQQASVAMPNAFARAAATASFAIVGHAPGVPLLGCEEQQFSGQSTMPIRDASPVGSSSATESAAASPSPHSGHRWRYSPAMLPADIAALLASPAIRTRLASPPCLRDMAAALDVCAAALQGIDKSLGSYSALLAESAPGAVSAGPRYSPALCGKARSLQDALQTLLEHTTLLLNDVQTYSQATHTQEQIQQQARSRPASPSTSRPGSRAGSPVNGGTTGHRNYQAEAAFLLERANSYKTRLEALCRRAEETLKMWRDEDGSVGGPISPRTDGAPHRHLTDEQRKLCSTTQLDNHLKAVGMAQFALVQDIHKELAALAATYFRHTGVASGNEGGSNGGGDGSAGGVSTGSGRKARVFKLGEYQLKQLRNGDIYKGRYVHNKKNGEGVYHFINADVYEGEFRDDRMDGCGVYTFSHEGRYEGQWRNAVYNGTGAETFAKGSTYHGEYMGGLRNGWGVCRFYNGDYYEGQWVKGLRDGSGMQQCTDDSNFVGDYQRGKRHGHGVYSFPNGDRYEGQYFEDLPHGFGTYHFASGQCYQGQWQQGKKHGWSVYTVDNGSRFMGLWSEGKPTWVQPLNGDSAASASEDTSRSLRHALEARDLAAKAATEARKRAASHWEVFGPVQTRLQAALQHAQTSSSLAQQARRKACDLAARLDAAVALLRTQGSVAPVATATP